MRNIYLLGFILILLSCGKTEKGQVNETIYVRHAGADMPAYVHGNLSSQVFLVVVHGAGSFGLSFREGIFTSDLEKQYAVVYLDQRGQSMAEGHYGKPDDLLQLMADDVAALINVLKNKYGEDNHYFLMGHSLGGAITLMSLLNNGLRYDLSGWISVDGAINFPYAKANRRNLLLSIAEEQIAEGNDQARWKEIITDVTLLDPEENYNEILKYVAKASDLLVSTGVVPDASSKELVKRTVFDNNPLSWFVSGYFNQPVQIAIDDGLDLTPRLPEVGIPALFLYGKYDMSVPYGIGESGLGLLGSKVKRFTLFEHSMHHPFYTEPDKFGDEVSRFIEENK